MVAPDLPREAEVVVVGGGCMGASIAAPDGVSPYRRFHFFIVETR